MKAPSRNKVVQIVQLTLSIGLTMLSISSLILAMTSTTYGIQTPFLFVMMIATSLVLMINSNQ